jgi:hypothetical protein
MSLSPIQDRRLDSSLECAVPKVLGGSPTADAILDPRTLPAREPLPDAPAGAPLILLGRNAPGLADELALLALECGHAAIVVLSAPRALPPGVRSVILDRKRVDWPAALSEHLRKESPVLAVDCDEPTLEHAQQDLELADLLGCHLAFLSSDLVYDPEKREFPLLQDQDNARVSPDAPGEAGLLRQAEDVFLSDVSRGQENAPWTILRTTLLLTPKHPLGIFPPFAELPNSDTQAASFPLIGGGRWLVQPLSLEDLLPLLLALPGCAASHGVALDVAGPVRLEYRRLCLLAASRLSLEAEFPELSVAQALREHPEYGAHLCHRIYPIPPRLLGLPAPQITPEDSLAKHLSQDSSGRP